MLILIIIQKHPMLSPFLRQTLLPGLLFLTSVLRSLLSPPSLQTPSSRLTPS